MIFQKPTHWIDRKSAACHLVQTIKGSFQKQMPWCVLGGYIGCKSCSQRSAIHYNFIFRIPLFQKIVKKLCIGIYKAFSLSFPVLFP